jgi:glycosyltransferase involved in cell wall biosynthesis
MLVGKFRRAPFVYDVQDLWPEALIATGNIQADSGVVRWINKLCGLIYRNAARIVVLSEGYKKALIAKKVPANKIERIFNWCDESQWTQTATSLTP